MMLEKEHINDVLNWWSLREGVIDLHWGAHMTVVLLCCCVVVLLVCMVVLLWEFEGFVHLTSWSLLDGWSSSAGLLLLGDSLVRVLNHSFVDCIVPVRNKVDNSWNIVVNLINSWIARWTHTWLYAHDVLTTLTTIHVILPFCEFLRFIFYAKWYVV